MATLRQASWMMRHNVQTRVVDEHSRMGHVIRAADPVGSALWDTLRSQIAALDATLSALHAHAEKEEI
jgi:hypothetical protein